jgi:hypothetical protein
MTEPSVEEQLDELQRESVRRRLELQEIAAQLPLSRRAMLRSLAADLRHTPGKVDLFRRALLKAARALRDRYRLVLFRLRESTR